MRAAVLEHWKSISVAEIDYPEAKEGDVILKVSLAGVCGSDVHIFHGANPIAVTPVVQGHEFMGTVAEANGQLPHGVRVGSRVVIHPLVSCGNCGACKRKLPHVCELLTVIGVNRDGGFAEYVRVPADKLIPVPEGMREEIAVLTEPFAVGYHACRRSALQPGERILVIGCGPIGLYSALVARKLGASQVLISEPNASRRQLAESFNIETVNPLDANCAASISTLTEGYGFDVVIETSGVADGINFAIDAAAVNARIASLGFPADGYANYNVTRGIVKEISFIGSRVYPLDEFGETLHLLEDMRVSDRIDFSRIVTDIRSLDDVERTIGDVATGREVGKILIRP